MGFEVDVVSRPLTWWVPWKEPKKNSFLRSDRAPEGGAVLVLLQVRLRLAGGIAEEGIGVEDVVADELPDIAVEFFSPLLVISAVLGTWAP